MRLYYWIFILAVLLFFWGGWQVYERYFVWEGESAEAFEALMIRQMSNIKAACRKAEIEPRLLVSVLYAERRSNINRLDDYEGLFAHLGSNTSMGIAQIRIDTARWILETVADSSHAYGLPVRFWRRLPEASGRYDLIRLLEADSTNLLLAALHIRQILSRWDAAGFGLADRPDIVTTLYSYGLYQRSSGLELTPHAEPKSNELGRRAEKFYRSGQLLEYFPLSNQ